MHQISSLVSDLHDEMDTTVSVIIVRLMVQLVRNDQKVESYQNNLLF